MEDTTTIRVSGETWKQLNRRKQRGETFDDVISDLMSGTIERAPPEFEPEVVSFREVDGSEECANYVPDRGGCDNDAEYVLTIQNDGSETEVPYCGQHAGIDQ